MGREALLTVLSCLILKSESVKVINIAGPLMNNVAAASVSRLYRNVPLGMYASNAPYAAYSFQVPSFAAPKANQVVPVKEEKIVIQNSNGFLKDSYGNTYHETPQSIAYKTIYPQQYVQLQNLPAHLSQPLGMSPSYQFKHGTPHFFGPAQYTIQSNVQGFSPSAPRYTISQPIIYGSNAGGGLSLQLNQATKQQTQQPSNSKDVYVETHSSENPSESKFHRVEQLSTPASYTTTTSELTTKQVQQSSQTKTVPKKLHFEKEMSFVTDVNGQKTEVKVKTKPPLPLLDISLLEPLTFDNPLVPQVQHFLPRIHDATYHKLPNIHHAKKHQKEFVVQNTKTYDSSSPKKKHKKAKPHKDDNDDEVQPTPSIKSSSPNDSPEFSYEVNSPNYKETYSEQKVSYNKESESEPVHINYEKQTENEPISYSYEKHTENKPVHYSYVHDSSKPEEIKVTHYDEEEPKQLIFDFTSSENSNSNENAKQHKEERHATPHIHKEYSRHHSPETHDSDRNHHSSKHKHHNDHKEHHHGSKKHHHPKPEHREKASKHHENSENHGYKERTNSKPEHVDKHFQPLSLEYEEDITNLPKYKPHSDSHDDRHEKHHDNKHDKHHSHSTKSHKPQFHNTQYSYSPSVHEKSKKIVIKEDSPATDDNGEHFIDAMIKQREENEENFEKAYKNAAYGFPAYDRPVDVEKDIYNPESYGASNYQTHFDVENSPLAQYQAQGDEFPQDTRAHYKDANDKMKEEYFLDYAISRPSSILDRFKDKENYYKIFEKQKPQKYYAKPVDNRNNAYTLQPMFSFVMPKKQANAKLTVSPYLYEYDYSKEAPKQDNSAYPTQPFQRYKSNTQFVEPQFQYGFEPVSLPRLLDSELAAMASNDNMESEVPGSRKKIYKENFYIKKTTTANGR